MRLMTVHSCSRTYPLLRLALGPQGVAWSSCLKLALFWLILPCLVTIGSYIDHTWLLPGNGRGLLQHYGVWALFISTPLIVALTAAALEKFLATMKMLANYSVYESLPRDLRRVVVQQIYSLSLRGKLRYLLWLMMFAGLGCGILNIRRTIHPVSTYGNDVFDSHPYLLGFVLNKAYLCLIWTVVYPAAIFVTLHITYSLITILRHMCTHRLFRIDFFNQDNCGGMSVFGFINLLVLSVWAVIFLVIAALFLTHARHYDTLVVSLFVTSAVFILQSFVAVYHIHKFVRTKRSESLSQINQILNEQMFTTIPVGRFSSDLLTARNHLLAIKTYPYARYALTLVNIIRFAPAMIAVMKVLF